MTHFDSSIDKPVTAVMLQQVLHAQRVFVPVRVTNSIHREIWSAVARKPTERQGTSDSIPWQRFIEWVKTVMPASRLERSAEISKALRRSTSFVLAFVLFLSTLLQLGNDVLWVEAPMNVKGVVYRIQSLLVIIGSFGFISLLFDNHSTKFDELEQARLRLKTDIVERVKQSDDLLPAGWATGLCAKFDLDGDKGSMNIAGRFISFKFLSMHSFPNLFILCWQSSTCSSTTCTCSSPLRC